MGAQFINGDIVTDTAQDARNLAYPVDEEYETMQDEIDTINQNLNDLTVPKEMEITIMGTASEVMAYRVGKIGIIAGRVQDTFQSNVITKILEVPNDKPIKGTFVSVSAKGFSNIDGWLTEDGALNVRTSSNVTGYISFSFAYICAN